MYKVLISLALSLALCSQGLAASAPSCQAVFLSKNAARAELEEILKENYEISSHSLFQKMILKYSARRLHKTFGSTPRQLRESVTQIDRLIQVAESLETAGEKGTYLEKDWVRREVLSKSVAEIMRSYGYESAEAQSFFKKVISHRAIRFLINPAELPFLADRPVPPEILEKMFQEGPESVRQEIRDFYVSQKQYQVDSYRAFARVYKWVAVSIFAILALDQVQESKERIEIDQKDRFEKSLADLDEMLSVLDEEFERRGLYKEKQN